DVEHDVDERDDVEARVEVEPRLTDRRLAALVRLVLADARLVRSDERTREHRSEDEPDRDEEERTDAGVRHQHCEKPLEKEAKGHTLPVRTLGALGEAGQASRPAGGVGSAARPDKRGQKATLKIGASTE